MGSSNTQDELESRFANLLQPIRDLTKNWDVDIASSLEDYLEEVGNYICKLSIWFHSNIFYKHKKRDDLVLQMGK